MKKIFCMVLALVMLCCSVAFADQVEAACYAIEVLNQMNDQVYGTGPVYTAGGPLEDIGMNFGNDDGSLALLLVSAVEGEGYDTGVVICSDFAKVRQAMNTLVVLTLIGASNSEGDLMVDATELAAWFDGQHDTIQECFADPAFDDGSEGSGVYVQEFNGENGLYSEVSVMRVDGNVRLNITFDFRPAVVFPMPEA